ncbi:hypothetical protein [Thermodesulfobacterium thermophilum]|uniref:hypothetical protein n=1 Tax=Thermodesulfobacterium thermophilum TaxID=886 RepID=UPI0003B7559D|nr:hypothetical protein [Thermodesulfobacterium thermophilum]
MRSSSLSLITFIILLFLTFFNVNSSIASHKKIDSDLVNNFTYRLTFGNRTVTLKDGKYEQPFPDYLKVWVEKFLIKDLNGDSIPDAVVVLGQSGGGSGIFYELTALISKADDTVFQTKSIVLGDRLKIENIEVVNRPIFPTMRLEILLDMLTHKESDPSCCPSKKELLCFTFDGIELIQCEEAPVVKKPAIYLYPEKPTRIKVDLNIKGTITDSIPEYKTGWEVRVTPDGKIDGKYDYLFYEAQLEETIKLPDEGWIVPYCNLENWFDEYLPQMGLKEREIKDFKDYWIKALSPARYYIIKMVDREFLEKNLKLSIIPEPQTVIRVILYFEAVDEYRDIKPPKIQPIKRKGFTAVEWGGISKDPVNSDIKMKPEYSFLATDTGILVLRAVEVKEHKIAITVNTKGCTDKNSVKAEVNRIYKIDNQVPTYQIVFKRTEPDNCKALLPEGTVLVYDLQKEFGFQMPYTVEIKNLVIPMVRDEPFFIFSNLYQHTGPINISIKVDLGTELLKKRLIDATIRAIKMEIKRYKASQHPDKQQKIAYLENELKRFENMGTTDYKLTHDGQSSSNPIEVSKFGPLMPPVEREVEVVVTKPYDYGSVLEVVGMTKSGPFYHIAGIEGDDLSILQSGKYKLKLYLVYKREYFGPIGNYYVYVDSVERVDEENIR